MSLDDMTNLFLDFGIAYAFENGSEDKVWHQCQDAVLGYAGKIRRECSEEIAALKAELAEAREELADMDNQINMRLAAERTIRDAIVKLDRILDGQA
jgi:hypothetical protein